MQPDPGDTDDTQPGTGDDTDDTNTGNTDTGGYLSVMNDEPSSSPAVGISVAA